MRTQARICTIIFILMFATFRCLSQCTPPYTPTVNVTQPTCAIPTGTITVTSPYSTYLYSFDNGATFGSATSISGLNPGTYTVIAQKGGCNSAATPAVINAGPGPSAPSFSITQPTCTTPTGTITINSPVAGYAYSFDNGATFGKATVASGLFPGNHIVIAKNSSGCVSTGNNAFFNGVNWIGPPSIKVTQPCNPPTGTIAITDPIGLYGSDDWTYSFDNGATFTANRTKSGLAPGTYNVISAVDLGGCFSFSLPTIAVVNAPVPTPSISITQPSCEIATGTIAITSPVSGYRYSFDGSVFGTGTNSSGMPPGTYSVTAENASNCISIPVYAVLNAGSNPPTPTVAVTQGSCSSPTGAFIIASPIVGYKYSFDNGVTFGTATKMNGLIPGDYNIIAQNSAGCNSIPKQESLIQWVKAPSISITQPTCTITTGAVKITSPVSGTLYSFNNGVTFGTATSKSGLVPGSYSVIASQGGCVSVASSAVVNTVPGPSAPVVNITQPNCATSTGVITVKYPVSGYQYSFDNGATFGTATTVTIFNPDIYNVIAKDGSGCSSVTSLAVVNSQPSTPVVGTVTIIQPTCSNPTGGISIDPNSVNNTYLYSFDNGPWASNTSIVGLAPGSHQVRAMNTSGCISSPVAGVVNSGLSVPSAPTITVTQPNCSISTGTINITSPISGFQYSFDNDTTFSTATSKSGLKPGGYNVSVKDTSGCSSPPSFASVKTAPSIPSAPTLGVTQPNCAAATGTITITSPISGYQYSFNNDTTFSTNTSKSGLQAGSYNVTTQNASGCNSPPTLAVVNAAPPGSPSAPSLTVTQPSCGALTGTITITSPVSGYKYSFDDDSTFSTATSKSGLSIGNYNVIAQNTSGCNSPATFAVVHSSPIPAAPSTSIIQPNCAISTGTISITSAISGYQYSFDNGLTFGSAISKNGLLSGSYSVIAQNTSGCNSSASLVVVNAAPAPIPVPSPSVSITNQSGCTTPTGAISINSPVAGYLYSFNNGATYDTLTSISGLAAGTYQVIAMNAMECISSATAAMVNSAIVFPPSPSVSTTAQTSCAAPTGAISINSPVNGYQYSFNNGATFSTATSATGLPAGTYQVVARSGGGCTSGATMTNVNTAIIFPPPPSVSISAQTSCAVPNGAITINSPVAGYQYSFNNGTTYDTLTSISGLIAGTYQVIAKTPQACNSTSSITMVVDATVIPPSPVVSITAQTSCATPTGGIFINSSVAGYQYSFNNGVHYDTISSATGLAVGTYAVIAKTQQGCKSPPAMAMVVSAIVVPPPPAVSVMNQSGCTWSTGSITISSPTAGYQYSFDNGATYDLNPSAIGLSAGPYQVIAMTPQGCVSSAAPALVNSAIVLPTSPSVSITAQTSCGTPTGAIAINSPVTHYQYSFDNGATYDTLTIANGLAAGTYQVIAMDTQLGCTSSATLALVNNAIVYPPAPSVGSIAQTSCALPVGAIFINPPVAGYQYSFDNGATYDTLTMINGLPSGTYQVIAMTPLGCTSPPAFSMVNDARILPSSPSVSIIQPDCATSTGTISIISPVTGYQYSFDNGATYGALATASGLIGGTYQVIAKNLSGCNSTAAAALVNIAPVVPTQPTLSLDISNSAAPILTSTSAASYQWFINGTLVSGDTLQTLTVTAPGAYTVVVVSSGGCASQPSAAQVIVVTQIEKLPSKSITPYPNPSTTTLFLDLSDEINSVQIFNSSGAEVAIDVRTDGSRYEFGVGHLSSGVYILNLSIQSKSYAIKFIKL